MLIRLVLASHGTFKLDRLFAEVMPITVMMGFLLIPMVILVASGDADLSFGFLAGLVGLVITALSPKLGVGAAVFVGLVSALAVGAVNGLLVGWIRLKGIVVTFATSFLLYGLILVISGGKTTVAPGGLGHSLARSPLFALLWLLLLIAFAVLLKFTPLGRSPERGGPAHESLGARLLYRGLPFVLSGAMAWIAGILMVSWTGYATFAMGMNYAEVIFLATLLGGTAYGAGTGFLLSGAIGLAAVVLFQHGSQMAGVPTADQIVVEGVVLLVMLPVAHIYHTGVERLFRRLRNR
ncbi:MAG: hypothetical protein JW929_13805 [Anaerolineales bacterium]|nr:hypothetical protein [Anaerolineales bacterium]